MPIITSITPNSPAARKNIAAGDVLISINGNAIHDILDYRFYATEKKLALRLARNGKFRQVRIRKDEYDDLGLEFELGLMSEQQTCQNKCEFCFIDQLPPGLRTSLYFKDDDARLGFLFGNYITLTNLTQREVDRIVKMKLSPVNVSVHTTNPGLRNKLMGNPRAGESLKYLVQFAQAELELNIQLVLCPGQNDGDELRRSLQDLLQLPTVKSIAAVPVGLTKFREKLPPLRPFTKEEAQAVINIFAEFQSEAELCCSDEFFLLAGVEMPGVGYYGDFRQLENGVGMWALLKQDMLDILHNCQMSKVTVQLTIATGVAAYPLMQLFVDELQKMWHNIDINVRCVENKFFGPHITVAGLLTAQDVMEQLRSLPLRSCLLLPSVMFNQDGLTLDGHTLEDISQALGVPVKAVENDAQSLIDAISSINIIP